jgi:hypothetical protein
VTNPTEQCDQHWDCGRHGARRCVWNAGHDFPHVAPGPDGSSLVWPSRPKRSSETFHGNVSAKRSEVRRGEETPLTPLPSPAGGSAGAQPTQTQTQQQKQSWEGGEPW